VPDATGARYDLTNAAECIDSFDRPLVPFVRFAIEQIEPDDPDCDLAMLSAAESVLDDPTEVLNAQRRRLQDARRQELWQPGMSLEETGAMRDELDAITHPKPMEEEIGVWFRHWSERHPFIADRDPSPKSVARELLERGLSFAEFIRDYGLPHHEQSLYYYLSDLRKVLGRALDTPLPARMQTPNPDADPAARAARDARRREAGDRLLEDLAALVDTIDSSVAEEWQRHGLPPDAAWTEHERQAAARQSQAATRANAARIDGLIRRMARTQAFRWVEALATESYARLAHAGYPAEQIAADFEAYWEAHDAIPLSADARGPGLVEIDLERGIVRQTILDPEESGRWQLEGQLDMAASRAEGRAVMTLTRIVDTDRERS
jgi:hypothetical protein